DEAFLDFVEGMRKFDVKVLDPLLKQHSQQVISALEAKGQKVATLDQARAALESSPFVQTKWRVRRTEQEMSKLRIIDSYRKREAELLAELDTADKKGPGTVQWDPNFEYPDYFKVDFHLQPGGYFDDPLAGYYYHYGTKVFYQGENDNDENQRGLVN